MLKVIRHPPRLFLDPLKGLEYLQDHQLYFLIPMLSRPILEHEGMDQNMVKKIYKIRQFLTLYEKDIHLGAIS